MTRQPDSGLLLARSLCHELRPPMATLGGLLRALETAPTEPRRAELARLAVEHVTYAEAVLGQAAESALGLAGKAVPPVPLEEILPAVAVTAPAQEISVDAGRWAARWPVHPHHTRQILINLMTNALRYAPGHVLLSARLSGWRLSAPGRARRLRLTVRDRGRATPELHIALQRRTPPPDERGLGLWVVRQRVAELGGTIHARPLIRGLAMEVTLPRYRG